MGFDPEQGYAFSTYAWRAIERAVWQTVARAERPEGVVINTQVRRAGKGSGSTI